MIVLGVNLDDGQTGGSVQMLNNLSEGWFHVD